MKFLLLASPLLLRVNVQSFQMSMTSSSHQRQVLDANNLKNVNDASTSRRSVIASFLLMSTAILPGTANAFGEPDCLTDCLKNCRLIAPKDTAYCNENCQAYCAQTDRQDGLSGSVSSTKGEMGIMGTSTKVKGDDKPPGIKLPGLDFTSDKGKKLIGY